MKQLLINSLLSLVTGICFMAGVFISTWLFEQSDKSKELIYIEQLALPITHKFQLDF